MSRRIANIHRNITVTPFLNKLYSMVDDEKTDDLIRWSDDGNSFLVLRHEDFAKEVLPKFFKHSNFSSFVRQLNMYGFHKVPHLQQGGLITEGPEAESWEFSNENFQQGQPDLLHYIRRKKGNRDSASADQDADMALLLESSDGTGAQDDGAADADTSPSERQGSAPAPSSDAQKTATATASTAKSRASRVPPVNLAKILKEIQVIRDHQLTISADIKRLQEDNQSLWLEASATQERYQHHQETIDKILRFLASVFSSDTRHTELQAPQRRLISHNGSQLNNAPSGGSSSVRGAHSQSQPARVAGNRSQNTSSGYTTPQAQSMFESMDFDDILSTEQPPDKKLRTSASQPSRIFELPSIPSSPAESVGLRSPQGPSARSSRTGSVSGSANTISGMRRKTASPRPSQITKQQTRPAAAAGPQPPPVPYASGSVSSNALVSTAGNPLYRLKSNTKSIEQLQQEVDQLGISLDSITQQLLPSANMQAANIALSQHPLLGNQLPVASTAKGSVPRTAATAAAATVSNQLPALDDIASSLLTPEALNSLALSLTQAPTSNSVPIASALSSTLPQAATSATAVPSQESPVHGDLASSLLTSEAMNNLALSLAQNNTSAPGRTAGSSSALDAASSSMPGFAEGAGASAGYAGNSDTANPTDQALLSSILEAYTPEQLDSLQRLFNFISGSKSTMPLLTAGSDSASAAQTPENIGESTPFLDFVDPNADAGFDGST